MLAEFLEKHRLDQGFSVTAESWFIPLGESIAMHHKRAKRPIFVGINGCQGSGKSTLSDFLQAWLSQTKGLNVVVLSLDDFYLSKSERMALSIKVHPLFRTRGVPGTHNMGLAFRVLQALRNGDVPLALPRFNKAIDDPLPKGQWPQLSEPADIILFEGWCWGVNAQSADELLSPVNALEANEDPIGVWRKYANRQLRLAYQPLYKMMDFWVMLKAPSFESVYQWRLEQEQKLADATQGNNQSGVMSAEQVSRFIQFYQRLTEAGLASLPARCHQVFELDNQRHIVSHTSKEDLVSP